MPSVICLPTFITGFSDVIGSWKIIAISGPHMDRIFFGLRLHQVGAVEEHLAARDRRCPSAAGA